jgi:hypothetical protein
VSALIYHFCFVHLWPALPLPFQRAPETLHQHSQYFLADVDVVVIYYLHYPLLFQPQLHLPMQLHDTSLAVVGKAMDNEDNI